MSKKKNIRDQTIEPRVSRFAWIVWTAFIVLYLAMNAFFVFGVEKHTAEILVSWGIGLPILTNLIWWVISFRLRNRIQRWWAFGICTAVVVGLAGFLSMLAIAQMQAPV